MLPTRLNVLSPEKQKHLQKMIRGEFIRTSLGVAIIVLSVIGMALLAGRAVLHSYFADLADTIHAVNVTTKDKNAKIELANTRISLAERLLAEEYYWPDALTTIAEAVPSGVLLSKIMMNSEDSIVILTGVATTREDLLALAESLRGVSGTGLVDIPISQLTQQENISFTIRVEYMY